MKSLLDYDQNSRTAIHVKQRAAITLRLTDALSAVVQNTMDRTGFVCTSTYVKHLVRCDALGHADDDLLAVLALTKPAGELTDLDDAIAKILAAPEHKRAALIETLLGALRKMASPLFLRRMSA